MCFLSYHGGYDVTSLAQFLEPGVLGRKDDAYMIRVQNRLSSLSSVIQCYNSCAILRAW